MPAKVMDASTSLTTIGANVGLTDGDALGDTDGAAVGEVDGSTVGEEVGDAEGIAVGCSVLSQQGKNIPCTLGQHCPVE